MYKFPPHGLIFVRGLTAVLLAAACPPSAHSVEQVTVLLKSGRSFTAAVDTRTDERQLWLRFDGHSTVVRRPVNWDQVVGAQHGQQQLSPAELRKLVVALGSDYQKPPAASEPQTPTPQPPTSLQRKTPRATSTAANVRSFRIEASLGHWDNDVEADGLIVSIHPQDDQGRFVPVQGALEVELIGTRRGAVTRGSNFPNLGRWFRQVRLEDFEGQEASYRLQFQAVHPEFHLDVSPYGLVHARLSVPGQGTFEASTSTVRVRPYNAVRDWLQQATQQRFFFNERTERGFRSPIGHGR